MGAQMSFLDLLRDRLNLQERSVEDLQNLQNPPSDGFVGTPPAAFEKSESLHPLAAGALQQLRDNPYLRRRTIKAEPQADGTYCIGVAVRLDDGAIVTAIVRNVRATWDQVLSAMHSALDDDHEAFIERSAIREFDGLQPRAEAEADVLLEIIAAQWEVEA